MVVKRDFYLEKLVNRRENGRIKVITGIRRCGKSVLLFDLFRDSLLASGIAPEQIITLKLDTAGHARYRNPQELDAYVRGCIADEKRMYYVLIDEIQEVQPIPNPWLAESGETIGFVDVLLGWMDIRNADIYVTGSNSRMLSSDIMTEFKDRGDEIHVNPLTFREFSSAYDGRDAWQAFCTYGGMPRLLSERTDEDKSAYLRSLIRNTYLTDVAERNRINNEISVLDDLLNVVASGIGSLTNPTKLENTFATLKHKRIADSTISTYLGYFEEAYILRKAMQYDIKGKKYINTPLKYYFTDVGLRNAQLNFRQQEENHIMENVLYNELTARGFNVDVGIVEYNYKDAQGKSRRSRLEVDFVANKGGNRCYIQSAFAIPDAEKRAQETNSLRRTGDSYRKVVVVREPIKPWYDENGIYYIGVEDFALRLADQLL